MLKNKYVNDFFIDNTYDKLKIVFKNYYQKKNNCQKLMIEKILVYLINLDFLSSKKKTISIFEKLFNNIKSLYLYLDEIKNILNLLTKKICKKNPGFIIDYYILIAKILNNLDFENLEQKNDLLIFFIKLITESFNLIKEDNFEILNKNEFFLSLTEIWFIILQNFIFIDDDDRNEIFKMAEKTPFLKNLDFCYLNKIDLEVILDEEKNDKNIICIINEFKKKGFCSYKKLKNKSSGYISYIYLGYLIFMSKLQNLKNYEYEKENFSINQNIIENLFFYLRDNFQQNLDNFSKFFSSLSSLFEIIKKEYFKILKNMQNLNLQFKLIEKDFIILLQYINIENKKVSKIAKELLEEYIYNFPQIFYSINIFITLCQISQKLHKNINSKYSTISPKLIINNYNQKIPLPSDKKLLLKKLECIFENYTILYYISFIFDSSLAFKCFSYFINCFDDRRNQETITMRFFYVLKQFNNISDDLILDIKKNKKFIISDSSKLKNIYEKLTKKKEFQILNKNIKNFINNINNYDFVHFELDFNQNFLEHNFLKTFDKKIEIMKLIKNCFNYQILYIQKYEKDILNKQLISQLKEYLHKDILNLLLYKKKNEKNLKSLFKKQRNNLKRKIEESISIFFLSYDGLSEKIEFIISDIVQIISNFKFDFIYTELLSQISKMMLKNPKINRSSISSMLIFMINELTKNQYEKSFSFNKKKKKSFIYFKKEKLDFSKIVNLKKDIFFIKNHFALDNQFYFISKLLNYKDYYQKINCFHKIINFVKKYINYLFIHSSTFSELEQIIIKILDLNYEFVRNLSLSTFLAVNKLFIKIIKIKINKKTNKKIIINDELIIKHIFFNLNYFSKKFHLTYKDHTDYSIKDLSSHKKFIKNLIDIYSFIKDYFCKEDYLNDYIKFGDYHNKSFYNKKLFSSFKKKIILKNKDIFINDHFLIKNMLKTKLIYKGILLFIKTKANLLRSLLYKEYEKKRLSIFNDTILSNNEISNCFKEIFKINALTANYFLNL